MMYLPRFCGSMSDYGRGHFGVYIQSSRFKGFVITKIDLIEILAWSTLEYLEPYVLEFYENNSPRTLLKCGFSSSMNTLGY